MSGLHLRGGCLCGDVRYAIPVAAIRFGFASCHCSSCRRAHAAPVVMWAGATAEDSPQFQVDLRAGGAVSSYRSSASCTRFFCARCGTHTHLTYDAGASRWSGETHIATATVDEECLDALEAHLGAAGRPRALHVFFSDRARCVGDFSIWASAPKYGGDSGVEPLA